MEVFFNPSKLSPPALPEVLYRTRLLDLLLKHQDKKLVLVYGQAAQGKSTLAATYARISSIPTAWINLTRTMQTPSISIISSLTRFGRPSTQSTFRPTSLIPRTHGLESWLFSQLQVGPSFFQ